MPESFLVLREIDKVILRLCGKEEVEQGERFAAVDTGRVLEKAKEQQSINQEQVASSFDVLQQGGYIRTVLTDSTIPYRLTLTDFGFDKYGRAYQNGYTSLLEDVRSQIINESKRTSEIIVESLGTTPMFVERILGWLNVKGYIKLLDETVPGLTIEEVYPALNSADLSSQ